MKVKTGLLSILVMVSLAISVTLSVFAYQAQKRDIMEGTDEKLMTAVYMMHELLTPQYHDNLMDKNSIAPQDYLLIIDRLNRICRELDIQYLWSNLVVDKDKIVFTSSTSTSKDVNQGDHALFFDVHSDPAAFNEVLQNQRPTYSTFQNEWGAGRMLLLPYKDKSGRIYVIGASISVDKLQRMLWQTLLQTLLVTLVAMILGATLCILLSRKITTPLEWLSSAAEQIATGEFVTVDSQDYRLFEIKKLANSVNGMSAKLKKNEQELSQKVMEKAKEIQRQHEYLKSIINNSDEGIMTVDIDGIIESFNPACEKIFGYTHEETIGNRLDMLIPQDKRAQHGNFIQEAGQHESKVLGKPRVFQALRKSGEIFSLEILLSKINSPAASYLAILRDVTAQVKAQQQLNQAKLQAEKANELKSQFLSSMSHELRTPLNSILGFGQILEMNKEANLNSSQLRCINEIRQGGEHLLKLIEDILDLAKIEAGEMQLALEAKELDSIIRDCVQVLEPQIQGKNITLEIDHESLLHWVRVDAFRIKQVFLNLLSNAIKYNNIDGRVTVSAAVIDRQALRVSVADTGCGICRENMEQLFLPFNRLGHENSQIAGSGIGLSITRKLVQAMGGHIDVESEEGKGSVFYVDLNLADKPERVSSRGEEKQPLPSDNAIAGTILYIEDNRTNRELMQRIIDPMDNVSLTMANSAEEGLKVVQELLPDLVLMDIDLPGMDGIMAYQVMQNTPEISHIPVIAISAAAMPADIEKAIKAGFVDYITKPFDIRSLLKAVKKALDQR